MTAPAFNVFEELKARGFIYQCTDDEGLSAKLSEACVTCYIGFDPTADSLHVGSLVPLMALRHVRRAGHRVILLTGSGTALVGDPSGKSEMRQMLTIDDIRSNAEGVAAQLSGIVEKNNDGQDCLALDNSTWLTQLNYIEFLRDVGRYMSINRMLGRESAKRRYESDDGLSFLEFNYMCLQGYDFLHLFREYACELQMGGQDQWGNICEGIDLIGRPDVAGGRAYGLTFPLLLSSSGEKFGKSVDGAVWLDPQRTPPFDYYQFWRNCEDSEVHGFLLLFSELEVEQIEKHWESNVNRSKEILAFEATRLVHGAEVAAKVYATACAQYRSADPQGAITMGSSIPKVAGGADTSVPTVSVDADAFPIGVLDLLVIAGMCKSKGEGRRLVRQGGVSVEGQRVQDEGLSIHKPEEGADGLLVAVGKKRRRRIVVG